MEDVKVIDLENETYIVSDEINIDNTKYVFLNKEKDILEFGIRKILVDKDQEYIVKLDSEEEFDKALEAFLHKHQKELENYN